MQFYLNIYFIKNQTIEGECKQNLEKGKSWKLILLI